MLNWWLPENVATYGAGIDWMFHLIYWITGITFILVTVTLLAFLWMYRDRPGRRARYGRPSRRQLVCRAPLPEPSPQANENRFARLQCTRR